MRSSTNVLVISVHLIIMITMIGWTAFFFHNPFWTIAYSSLYGLIGCGFWSIIDDEEGSHMVQMAALHHLLPFTLVILWPLFLIVWLLGFYLYVKNSCDDNKE